MWKKSLDSMIRELPDGNERILCIEMDANPIKLCIICVYLPCRGRGVDCEDLYHEALDCIREIYAKYQDSHTMILCGDLNASITKSCPSSRDKQLLGFCDEFSISREIPKQDSFFHVNGKDTAQSDYILLKQKDREMCTSYETISYGELPTNVSDHIPIKVTFNLALNACTRKRTVNDDARPRRTVWAKIDTNKYRHLTNMHPKSTLGCNYDVNLAIYNMTEALNEAALVSYYIPPKKPKKSKKGFDLWSPRIARLVKTSKEMHRKWVEVGSPKAVNHPTVIHRKKAKNELRSAIRSSRAIARRNEHDAIMEADSNDKQLFYKLIQKQRSNKSTYTDTLVINDCRIEGDEQVLHSFKSYFSDLATPEGCDDFSDDFKETADYKETILTDILCSSESCTPVEPITVHELIKIISSCRNGKAPDADGITAEHFKYAGAGVLEDLRNIINVIMKTKYTPSNLLHGTLTPILKKNKDKFNPANYRGITVTSIIGKLIEKAWLLRANPIIESKQSRLQRGFTAGCSSTNAALIITESIAEARDCRKPLFITFLDASKAFDVVDHSILMNELHDMGVNGDLWLILQQLYNRPTTSLKWKDVISESFTVQQGVRQGGASSAPLYKGYTNALLHQLDEHVRDHKIGTINIPAPTCADDMAIITHHPANLQAAIDIVDLYSREHRYRINPTKSATLTFNDNGLRPSITLRNQNIPYPDEYVHLGIVRSYSKHANIDERIQLARRAMYGLMGAGMHGRNGLSPQLSYQLWKIYVLPRMLYGLEVTIYTSTDMSKLDKFQRKTLRQLQFLPEKPSPCNQAVYGLLGAKPVEAVVDQSTLTHFGNILRSEDSIELDLAKRQLAVKNNKSKSWFIHVKKLLRKYDLPSPYELLENPPRKDTWKSTVSNAVNALCNQEAKERALPKSSLKYLNIDSLEIGVVHPVWSTLTGNPREIERAAVKARLLTGT